MKIKHGVVLENCGCFVNSAATGPLSI